MKPTDRRRNHLRLAAVFLATVVLAAVVALPVGASEASTGDGAWHDDLQTAFDEARSRDAYLVVDLYADWCGWCKKLEREVFPSEEFQAFAEDKVLLKVNVDDGGEGTALQTRHRAVHLPTTLILDPGGARAGKIQGYFPAADFVERSAAEIAAWERLEAKVPQAVESEHLRLVRDLAEEMHERGAGAEAARLYRRLLEDAQGEDSDGDAAQLHYLLADALRLARDWEGAEESLAGARAATDDPRLEERLDLLAYQVAEDHGDCQGAKSSLERFLDAHPESRLHARMARALRDLERGRHDLCA